VSDIYQLVGDHTNPILKPEAAQAVNKAGDVAPRGAPDFDTYGVDHQCVAFIMPDGIPIPGRRHVRRMRLVHAHMTDFMIIGIQNGDLVRALDHLHSNVPENKRQASGPTLVAGSGIVVDMYGTPHSEALRVVERYRLLAHEVAKEAEERGEKGNFRLPGSDPGFAPDPNYEGRD
jgi:hypothetical protein